MIARIALLLLVAIVPTALSAQWNSGDRRFLGAAWTGTTLDCGSTLIRLHNNQGLGETNPLLGPRPRNRDVVAVCIFGVASTYIIANGLTRKARRIFLGSVAAIGVIAFTWNMTR